MVALAIVLVAIAVTAADLLDVTVRPQDTLPTIPYAVSIFVAAYLLKPRLVAVVAAISLAARMLVAWDHQVASGTAALEQLELVIIGILGTMLSAKIWRERVMKAEAEISYLQFRGVIEGMVEGVIIMDPGGRVLCANRPALQIHGFTSEVEIAEANLLKPGATFELRSLDQRPMAPDEWPMARVLSGQALADFEAVIHPAGSDEDHIARYNGRLVHTKAGDTALGILTVRDVTAERQAAETLRQSEERFRLVAVNSPDIIFHQDLRLRYVDIVNPTPHFAQEQVLGKTDRDLFPEEEAHRLTEIKLRVLKTGAGERAEVSVTIGETARWYDLAVEPWRDRGSGIVGLAGYARDITDRQLVQAQLMEQQRYLGMLEERGRLARELHDSLGNVLSYVVAEGQAVRESLSRKDLARANEYLRELVSAAQFAVDDVREFITGARVRTASAGFFATIAEQLRRLEGSQTIHAELIVPPALTEESIGATIRAQLLRIVQEALANVRKHARARSVRVVFTSEGGWIQAMVEDDGRGFDSERAPEGTQTTFGLLVMRDRAEELGGSLQVSSMPGYGTRIIARVPTEKAVGVARNEITVSG